MTLLVISDRALKQYLLILTLIFAAAFFMGTLLSAPVMKDASDAFGLVVDSLRGLAGGKLFLYILVHNMIASFLILISGMLVGIIPILSMGANGFFLGVLYRQVAEAVGYSKAALMVLPHGILEIPALLIAASYGLWLGVTVVRRMRGKESIFIRSHMEHAFRRYFVVVFPLLIVAAGIETALILLSH